jgi:hypothetical protein
MHHIHTYIYTYIHRCSNNACYKIFDPKAEINSLNNSRQIMFWAGLGMILAGCLLICNGLITVCMSRVRADEPEEYPNDVKKPAVHTRV